MVKESSGPVITPVRLAKDPFSTTPVMSILIPINSVFTRASPLMFRVEGSMEKDLSAKISAVRLPWTGPAAKAPPPVMV